LNIAEKTANAVNIAMRHVVETVVSPLVPQQMIPARIPSNRPSNGMRGHPLQRSGSGNGLNGS